MKDMSIVLVDTSEFCLKGLMENFNTFAGKISLFSFKVKRTKLFILLLFSKESGIFVYIKLLKYQHVFIPYHIIGIKCV
jgi:hypothetical protein